ncbi:MAG: hypothetical protein ACPGVU_06960 [Limisphaerales bacterium]
MRLIERDENQLTFGVTNRQKLLFERILLEYPVGNQSQHAISKSRESVELPDQQELLDEALAENRAEMKRRVRNFLRDPLRFKEQESGWHVSILTRQFDWLLQVLNEIRVGSWYQLNCPESEDIELVKADPEAFIRMTITGQLQQELLMAFNGDLDELAEFGGPELPEEPDE